MEPPSHWWLQPFKKNKWLWNERPDDKGTVWNCWFKPWKTAVSTSFSTCLLLPLDISSILTFSHTYISIIFFSSIYHNSQYPVLIFLFFKYYSQPLFPISFFSHNVKLSTSWKGEGKGILYTTFSRKTWPRSVKYSDQLKSWSFLIICIA